MTDSGVNKQSTRDWDPMQSDYLGRRNKYSIDDEDVGSALLGYSEELIQPLFMRDEKEGEKKQARSNKQQSKATQHTQGSHFFKKNELPVLSHVYMYVCYVCTTFSDYIANFL